MLKLEYQLGGNIEDCILNLLEGYSEHSYLKVLGLGLLSLS